MDYINEILKEAMKNVKDDEDINFLRDISMRMFPEINREFVSILKNISSSIDELYINSRKEIYTAPLNKEKLEEYKEMLFPMIGNDIKSDKYTERENIFFRRIYLDTGYDNIKKFEQEKLKAELTLGGKLYKLDIYSKRYQKYCEKEEEFLNVLELNKKEWEVLYTPYSRRFFELYLKDVPEEIKNHLDEIIVDYGKYGDNIHENYFLAWNIEEKSVLADKIKSDASKQTYCYKIFSAEAETDLVKIADSQIKEIDRQDNNIYVYINSLKDENWELWRIIRIDPERFENLTFKLLGNKKTEDFISRFKKDSEMRVRSEAEIHEIIAGYEDIRSLKLKEITLNGYTEKTEDSFDMNKAFNKKVKIKRKNKDRLNLYFEVMKEGRYLKDELSFILSCVGYKYPEYEVRGIIKWR